MINSIIACCLALVLARKSQATSVANQKAWVVGQQWIPIHHQLDVDGAVARAYRWSDEKSLETNVGRAKVRAGVYALSPVVLSP